MLFLIIPISYAFAQAPDIIPRCIENQVYDPSLGRYVGTGSCDSSGGSYGVPSIGNIIYMLGDLIWIGPIVLFAVLVAVIASKIGDKMNEAHSENQTSEPDYESDDKPFDAKEFRGGGYWAGMNVKGALPKGFKKSAPMLLRDQELNPPKKKTVVPVPQPPPLESVETLSELWAEKLRKLPDTDWEEFFEKDGKCIKDSGGAIDSDYINDKFDKKIDEHVITNIVSRESPKVLPSTTAETIRKATHWFINELTEGRIYIDKMGVDPMPQIKILNFLVRNFGTEITTPYVCLYYHLEQL